MKTLLRSTSAWVSVVALIIASATHAAPLPVPAPPALNASSYIVLDANSGRVVAGMDPDKQVEPASLTKLMTAYVVFQALQAEQISLNDPVPISGNARATGGSRMFVEQGSRVSVSNLLQGMIVQSGNDASVALAEYVAGSEDVFAALMNAYAKELGMLSSNFENATGLPGDQHYSTARDMATLARAIIVEFPNYYAWYKQKAFTWNDIPQENRNRLLWQDASVDGMKTGYTKAAGYCLVSSAVRKDMRLISAVMGTPSAKARIDSSQALLNYGFRFYETRKMFSVGDTVAQTRVWKGVSEEAALGVQQPVHITVPRGGWDELQTQVNVPNTLYAPLALNDDVGMVRIVFDGEELARAPLAVLTPVERGGLWKRMTDEVRLWFE
ncbi:MAG: D-alanyl-D-alanine carboxypeptidase family protein [Pseudomonadota bacterium]